MAKKKERLEQAEIPGTERPVIKEIETAARAYRRIRDERMELTEQETAAKATLLLRMKSHKQAVYVFDGFVVSVIPGEDNVKVKKQAEPDEDKAAD
jgi:hypothetical protein